MPNTANPPSVPFPAQLTTKMASLWENVSNPPSFDAPKFFELLSSDPEKFPEASARQWVEDRFPLAIQISLAYVLVIFGTKYLMRNRQPFSLFVPLNAWNLFLAIFSTIGTIMLTPEFFRTLWSKGFQSSYCHAHSFTHGTNGYWVWLFIVSKMFELVDTVFLVLRKKPLLFLHWYHHILTLLYAFYSYPITPGFNRWGIYLNFFVHSYMYSYYFLRSMQIKVPGPVAKFVTTIQIWQFIISVTILVRLGVLVFVQNVKCDLDGRIFAFATGMDVSYLVLFINFFLHAYVLGGGKSKYKKAKGKKSEENEGKRSDNNGTGAINAGGGHATEGTTNGELRKREAMANGTSSN